MPESKVEKLNTLTPDKRGVSVFPMSPDVQRILKMKADALGYNEKVNGPITSSDARSYAVRAQERRDTRKKASDTLKGHSPPLGHADPPPLDKMQAIASLHTAVQPSFDSQEPPQPKKQPSDPSPIKGVGAAYLVNQALASGKTQGPVSLREGNRMATQQLSQESVRALEMANEAAKRQEGEPVSEPTKEIEPPSIAKATRDELEDAEKEFEPNFPSMDYAAIGDIRSTLMSQKRRDAVESRLGKLSVADMIVKKELVEVVSIIPEQLNVTLRTFTQSENLWVMKYIFDFPGSALYVQELINTCRLVCSLVAINGAYFPDHRTDVGTPSEKINKEDFEKKFFHLASLPVQLVADLSVQLMWFQDRVNKLLTLDELKNG